MKRREQVAIAAMGYCPPAATAARASPRRQYLFFLLRAERGLAGPSPIRRLAASVRHCGRVNLDLPGCRSETEAAALRGGALRGVCFFGDVRALTGERILGS